MELGPPGLMGDRMFGLNPCCCCCMGCCIGCIGGRPWGGPRYPPGGPVEAIPPPVDAMPGPVEAMPRGPIWPFATAGYELLRPGGGRVAAGPGPRVAAGPGAREAAGEGAVDAGPAPVCLRSAAWRIWSLRLVSKVASERVDPLEKVETGAADNPFDTVLVANSKGLPNLLFVLRPAGNGDAGTSALLGRVL